MLSTMFTYASSSRQFTHSVPDISYTMQNGQFWTELWLKDTVGPWCKMFIYVLQNQSERVHDIISNDQVLTWPNFEWSNIDMGVLKLYNNEHYRLFNLLVVKTLTLFPRLSTAEAANYSLPFCNSYRFKGPVHSGIYFFREIRNTNFTRFDVIFN